MDSEYFDRISNARLKYKPDVISSLFIAEAPPVNPDRFFYFEEVYEQDSLYLELMKGIFLPEVGNDVMVPTSFFRSNKAEFLTEFKTRGYYLIDTIDHPLPWNISRTKEKIDYLSGYKDRLIEKVNHLIDKKVPIVLISIPVFQAVSGSLKYKGFNVIHDFPVEFPGSGNQGKFHEKFDRILPKIR